MNYGEPNLQKYEHPTWGYVSEPDFASEQLLLQEYLAYLPVEGVVVDVGAGASLSLAKMIHILRPDATVINLDPGFVLYENHESLKKDIMQDFDWLEPDQQQVLTASDA